MSLFLFLLKGISNKLTMGILIDYLLKSNCYTIERLCDSKIELPEGFKWVSMNELYGEEIDKRMVKNNFKDSRSYKKYIVHNFYESLN